MKNILVGLFVALFALVARATPEITGVFTVDGSDRFVLVESDTGESSGWIKVGDEFRGYRLVSFDRKSASLVAERNGKTELIGLKNSKILEMPIALSGSIKLGLGQEAEAQKIVLFVDQESSFPWGPGATFYIKPKRTSDGNIEYRVRWEITGVDGKTEILKGPKMITAPGEGLSLDMGGYGFELKP